jgi:dienelactone hydrolase
MTGVTGEYGEVRATMVAEYWGFMGFTVDIFGGDPSLLSAETITGRMDAALEAILAMDSVDSSKVAVFGYSTPAVLMYAVNGLGTDTVKALVSFHGDISGNWLPEELKNVGPKLLVLSGEKDEAASEIMDLEITLDAANATWEITRYSGAGPSFTVFEKGGFWLASL